MVKYWWCKSALIIHINRSFSARIRETMLTSNFLWNNRISAKWKYLLFSLHNYGFAQLFFTSSLLIINFYNDKYGGSTTSFLKDLRKKLLIIVTIWNVFNEIEFFLFGPHAATFFPRQCEFWRILIHC